MELCRQWDLGEVLGFCTADVTPGVCRSQAHNVVLCLQLVALERKKKKLAEPAKELNF